MTACATTEHLVAWLDRELSVNQAAEILAHLEVCAACREKRAELVALTGALAMRRKAPVVGGSLVPAVSALLRLGPKRTAPRLAWLAGPALAAAVLFIAVRPEHAFQARGAGNADTERLVGFEAFTAGSQTALEAGAAFDAQSQMAFTLYNRTGHQQWLLLFGYDAKGEVHWFYPAHTDAARPPTARLMPADQRITALPELVAPDRPAPGRFLVIALFAGAAAGVDEVERLLARGGPAALAEAFPDAVLRSLTLTYRP